MNDIYPFNNLTCHLLFQMGVILNHLSRQRNVVDLKVPEMLTTGKIRGYMHVFVRVRVN